MAETTRGTVEIEDDAEVVVIEHPGTVGPNGATPHVHTDREVICRKSADEIVLEPMLNHTLRYRYVRSADRDRVGRPIFRREA